MIDVCAGELFVLGFDGLHAPPPSLVRLHERWGLGGAILFARNVEAPDQVRGLTAALRAMAPEPWFHVSTDQEGGRFQRLPPPAFGTYPAACDVDPADAFTVGERMGRELAGLGVSLDLAPVLDTHTNPDNPIINVRSFSPDPSAVATAGKAFVRGLKRHGVHACGKHFPGHGDTALDSHLDLPRVDHVRERLDAVELHPFREVIADGQLSCVMPAHVVYPALDPDRPATYSSLVLEGVLRRELGFTGVALTDDLGMAGALSFGDLVDCCVEAFAAGCDQLLVCEHHDRHEACVAAVAEAIAKSAALTARFATSRARIRRTFAGAKGS